MICLLRIATFWAKKQYIGIKYDIFYCQKGIITKKWDFLGLFWKLFVYLHLFSARWRWSPLGWVERWNWTLHNWKASYDALSIGWWNLGNFILLAKDIAEFDVTGMLKVCPVVCMRANHAFIAHLREYQQCVRGYHSVRQASTGLREPHQQASSRWIPTFFVVWLTSNKKGI